MIKNAVVTGASRGIGYAIAKEFVNQGYHVAMLSKDKTRLKTAVEQLRDVYCAGIFPVSVDLRDGNSVKRAFDLIGSQFRGIDILVNNAGINSRKTLDDGVQEGLSGFDDEYMVNLRGSYLCSRLAAETMIAKDGGCIVNISSIKGKEATSSPGYGASKAGLIKLTRDCAKAWAAKGIRVNCVAPGFIDCGMTAELSGKKREVYQGMIPMGRFGGVDEVAKVVNFLCSDDASYITGACIDVNGGYLMD